MEQYDELKAVEEVRAMRSGALLFVDVKARVPNAVTVGTTSMLERRIKGALVAARKDVFEVRVKFIPVDEDGDSEKEDDGEREEGNR